MSDNKELSDEELAEILKDIQKKHEGVLKPSDVVAFAEPNDSPLHGWFEWDDEKAGEKYRLEQARALIRTVVCMVEVPDDKPRLVRVFHALRSERRAGGGYREIHEIMSESDRLAQLTAEMLQDLIRMKVRYESVMKLGKIEQAANRLEKQLRLQLKAIEKPREEKQAAG